LYERETRQPGWREIEEKEQQVVNRGMDIVTYLHRKLIKEHGFKISGTYGKDPRPYVKKAITNWKIDEERKRSREEPLDDKNALEIPDPNSLEESVLEKITYEECKREIRSLPFPTCEDEFDLFETVFVEHSSLDAVRESHGIRSKRALDQRFSRSRKKFVAERDALLTFLLITESQFGTTGKIPRFPQNPKGSEWWVERAKHAIRPGKWIFGAPNGHNGLAVRSLTR